MEKLEGYRWPGNVRELRNVLERATILFEGTSIGADDLLLGRYVPTPEAASAGFQLPDTGIVLESR